MLYIATVHYRSPRWIEIQARYLREHIQVPFQTWSSLEGIDPSYAVHFDRVVEQLGPHAGKLNHLAMEIEQEAADEDLLMFLDGDAFPIADPMPRDRGGTREGEAARRAPCGEPRRTAAAPMLLRDHRRHLAQPPRGLVAGPDLARAHGAAAHRRRRRAAAPARAHRHALGRAAALQPARPRPDLLRDLRGHRLPPRLGLSQGQRERGPPHDRAARAPPGPRTCRCSAGSPAPSTGGAGAHGRSAPRTGGWRSRRRSTTGSSPAIGRG